MGADLDRGSPWLLTPRHAKGSLPCLTSLVIGAGITGVTTAYALLDRGCTRHRLRPQPLSRDGNLLRQWRPALGQQRRGLEQLVHRAEGPEVDAPQGRAAAAQPQAELAQIFLAGRVRRPTSATTAATRSRRPGSPSRRASICSTWPSAEGIDFDLERRGILHVYRDRASFDHASGGQRPAAPRAASTAAPVTPEEIRAIEPTLHGDILRRLLHPVRRDRRHPQIHPRPGRCLRPPGRHVPVATPR